MVCIFFSLVLQLRNSMRYIYVCINTITKYQSFLTFFKTMNQCVGHVLHDLP